MLRQMGSAVTMSPLATYLTRLGWSAERLAREVNRAAGPHTISRKAPYAWVKGSRPRGDTAELVAAILSARCDEQITAAQLWPRSAVVDTVASTETMPWTGPELLIPSVLPPIADGPAIPCLPGHSLTAPVLDWLATEPADLHGRDTGATQVTPAIVSVLAERVSQLRRLDDVQGGPLVLDWVTDDLRRAATLTRDGSYDPPTGRHLHQVLGELAQLAGWLACDQDLPGLGQRYLLIGLQAAHAAADTALGANIVSCLSYQTSWAGEQTAALSLIRAARKGLDGPVRGPVHALLATRQARVHAQLTDERACARALEDASSAYAERAEATPSWAYWVTPAVLAADAGRAWLELGRLARAEEALAQGLELFGQDQPRNRMLHNASLAEARLGLGNLEGAADAADHALDLGEQLVSGRAKARLRTLQSKFEMVDSRKAREVVDRARHVLGTS